MKELHDEGFTDFIPFLSIIGNGDEIFCFDKNNNIIAELVRRTEKQENPEVFQKLESESNDDSEAYDT